MKNNCLFMETLDNAKCCLRRTTNSLLFCSKVLFVFFLRRYHHIVSPETFFRATDNSGNLLKTKVK